MRQVNKRGTSLIELVTVLTVFAVIILIIYMVFFINWQTFDSSISKTDLTSEYEMIVSKIIDDARLSKQITVNYDSTTQRVIFQDAQNQMISDYMMGTDGNLTTSKDGVNYLLVSNKIDYASSVWKKNGWSLQMTLTLKEQVLNHPVSMQSTLEVYPRN